MPASSPALTSSSSTSKPRRSAQRICIRSTISAQSWASVPPAPALTRDERVARVVAPGEQALLLELGEALLDRGDLLVDLRLQRRVLGGHLGERVEVLDVARQRLRTAPGACEARACSADTAAARSASSQKPAAPISASSAATRSPSAAGSKIVREQLHLLADGGQALGSRLAGRGCGHAPTLSDAAARARYRVPRVIRAARGRPTRPRRCPSAFAAAINAGDVDGSARAVGSRTPTIVQPDGEDDSRPRGDRRGPACARRQRRRASRSSWRSPRHGRVAIALGTLTSRRRGDGDAFAQQSARGDLHAAAATAAGAMPDAARPAGGCRAVSQPGADGVPSRQTRLARAT